MPRYSHQLPLAFTVESDAEDGSDITPAMIARAIHERLKMPLDELAEACLPPLESELIE